MSPGSRSNATAGAQSAVDRFAWPVVFVLLLGASLAIAAAWHQANEAHKQRERLQQVEAKAAADFAAFTLSGQVEEYQRFAQSGHRDESLEKGVEKLFLPESPQRVRAVALTDRDGNILTASERRGTDLDDPGVVNELIATARSSTQNGREKVSGVLDIDGERAYAQAIPVTDFEPQYGALVVLQDAKLSALERYRRSRSGRDTPGINILDDRGQVIVGKRFPDNGEKLGSQPVAGTGWTVRTRLAAPGGVLPLWLYPMLLCAFVLLGAFYWLQEGTRRTLHAESAERADTVRRLYEFVSNLLHARGAHDQAERLALAAVSLVPAGGARVRIARERGLSNIVAGSVEATTPLRQYRIAITSPNEPVGELVCYRDKPFTEQERSIIRTMTTLAGAAMHTNVVLERERATAQELQRIDELRTNLLSTVAHELRSPLTAVKGMLGLLSMQEDMTDKQREYVALAEQRTDALVALIQDLFDCSLLENGQLDIKPERRQATDLLEGALGALAQSRPDELFISATPNLFVTVDPIRFDQLVNNLVTNAFRHGKPPVDVEVRPYAEGACVIISDNGPGIPEEERDAIFSKFYQSDSGHARLVEGAGLGLALVHGLVRLHGGRIKVDAAKVNGRGARFTVYLPDVTPEHVELGSDAAAFDDQDDEFGVAQLRSIS